jgi:hypothetical protein
MVPKWIIAVILLIGIGVISLGLSTTMHWTQRKNNGSSNNNNNIRGGEKGGGNNNIEVIEDEKNVMFVKTKTNTILILTLTLLIVGRLYLNV